MSNPLAVAEKEKGNIAYKAKQFEEAISHYDKAIEIEPSNITYYTNKSAVYFEQKRYEECIKLCEQSVDIGRENRAEYKLIAKAFTRMAHCYEKMDDLANAKKYFDKSLSECRQRDIEMKSKEIEKKLKENERLAYINPEIAEEEKTKGNKFFQNGQYAEAVKCYSEAIRRNPNDAKIYSNRAACYTKLMEFPLAIKDCNTCIELDPGFIKGYLRKGAVCAAMKDLIQAKEAYRKALEIDPNCEEAESGLFQAYTSTDDDPEARKRAMQRPEVVSILSDPAMRTILGQMQDPHAVRDHLRNPEVASKIKILMDAGIVSIR